MSKRKNDPPDEPSGFSRGEKIRGGSPAPSTPAAGMTAASKSAPANSPDPSPGASANRSASSWPRRPTPISSGTPRNRWTAKSAAFCWGISVRCDEYGLFVSVDATIRGRCRQNRRNPRHIHPGNLERHPQGKGIPPSPKPDPRLVSLPSRCFGVESSDMAMSIIQRNFFSGPAQIAFVSDPLGGEEAICANTDAGIQSIRRFWVDGRERRCYVPEEDGKSTEGKGEGDSQKSSRAGTIEVVKMIRELEDRVRQLTDALRQSRRNQLLQLSDLRWNAVGVLFPGRHGLQHLARLLRALHPARAHRRAGISGASGNQRQDHCRSCNSRPTPGKSRRN